MYQKSNSCLQYLFVYLFVNLFIGCSNKNFDNEHFKYDVFQLTNEICRYYEFNGEEFTLLKDKYCYSIDTLLNDYEIISPFLPVEENKMLVKKIMGKIRIYDITKGNLSDIPFEQSLNFKEFSEVCYFNHKIICLNNDNILSIYIDNNNVWIKDYETKIEDLDVFNIYGGINSDIILIEAGYFPSGGCEYIKYYSLDLNSYKMIDCTEKLLTINSSQSPFDVFYMDIDQEYFFFPYEQKEDFNWESSDDYILNLSFDIIGRALRKQVYYNGCGFSLGDKNELDYYVWQNEMDKLVCFPVNFNFEKQIYRTYYDSLLNRDELVNLDQIEIELLKNTIIKKNDGVIKSEKIKDILSLYTFYFDYKESYTIDEIIYTLEGNEKLNYNLLENMN